MQIYFLANMYDLQNSTYSVGLLLLSPDNKIEWEYIYLRSAGEKIIKMIQKRNPTNLFYLIHEILAYPYTENPHYFDLKPEYFDKVVTAEEAYEHLLCGKR